MSEADSSTEKSWLEGTLEAAGAGVWRIALPSRRVECTRTLERLLGADDAISTLDDWLALVHREDRPLLRIALERSLRHGAELDVEYRLEAHPTRWIRTIAREQSSDGANELAGLSVDVGTEQRAEDTLIEIARDLHGTGRALLDSITSKLAQLLEADFAFVGQVEPDDPGTIRMLSLWARGLHSAPIRYALAGTPCEDVVGGQICVHRAHVQEMFPADELLREMGVHAYAGVPLWDDKGESLGLLSAMWTRPLEHAPLVRPVLRILADITGRELWRSRLESDRRARADRLSKHNAALAELSRSPVWSSTDRLMAFRAVTEIGAKTLGVARVSVWLYDEERSSIVLQDLYERGTGRHEAGMIIEREAAPSYFAALDSDRAIAAELVDDDPRMKERTDYLHDNGITSMLDAPVRVEGRVAGVVCCEHTGPPRAWSEEEITFAGSLSDFASLAEVLAGRQQLETQLRHSQRLESIGRLAGGVAHDFNNLLTVIQASVEMLRMQGAVEGEDVERLDDVADAADRAAALTRQLLAFARSSPVKFQRTDVNEVVRDAERMLRRLIDEDIDLEMRLGEDVGAVWADISQLEQVLVNLAVNARDAMPLGGRLTLETSTQAVDAKSARRLGVPAGDYVTLVVSDSGEGMTEEVQSHVFEPFFTTKAPGRGTGLGLATCYGIVRQSNGFIFVESAPKMGTTFRILLPLMQDELAADESTRPRPARPEGSEVVLLVEDDASVRGLTATGLEHLGYKVLAADGQERAFELASEHRESIAVAVVDVVMPKSSGPEVAASLRKALPGVPILFVSGYPRGAISQRGLLDEDVDLLSKPFTPTVLAGRIRQLLDPRGERSAS